MLMRISQLHTINKIDKVILHSIDLSLYQASIQIDNVEYYIADNKGKLLREFNLLKMQRHFRSIPYQKMVLRQQSAYDEMIGLDVRLEENTLEVPIRDNGLS